MINHNQSPSILASLRRLVPRRTIAQREAFRLAELQAAKFRQLVESTGNALPEAAMAALPRISIQRRDLPTSGLSYWDGDNWIIALNRSEPEVRQRFTLMHEYKHIIDHGCVDRLYADTRMRTASEQAEQAADYFAACVLMPKMLIKRAWSEGVQSFSALGRLFDVSPRAVEVRLSQIGLTKPTRRCNPPVRQSRSERSRYYRSAHPMFDTEGIAA